MFVLVCAFSADMMDFSVQWKVTNVTFIAMEIIPYNEDETFSLIDGENSKELEPNGSLTAEVCRVHYITNKRGINKLRFYATSLFCKEKNEHYGYTLKIGDSTDDVHPIELTVTDSSTLTDNSTYVDVSFNVLELGRVNIYLYVHAVLDYLYSMSEGFYKGTIKVEVMGT